VKEDRTTLSTDVLSGGRVLRITLDAGRGNVLSIAVLTELREAVAKHAGNVKLRALLIDHSGEHFSYGASVEEHRAERVGELLLRFRLLAGDLLRTGLPLVASVRGLCLGGGLELVSLCDRVVCAPTAELGQPEIELGVFAPIASLLLPDLVGRRNATELLTSGRRVCADKALEIGLVSDVADDPTRAALAWIGDHLEPKSGVALRHATRAARSSWALEFLTALELLEADYLEELMKTRDANEGVAAFLEKRAPRWHDA
jgi:cyclohexa-1,5-dienecarbonyl-CoA hydratase